MLTLIAFIAVLAILVLAHEWGHFTAARRLGIAVEEFGVGFPPRLTSFLRGSTRYSINLLPLGGFVKLKGEGGEAREELDSFAAQKPWRRAVVLVAGVGMNIVTAWVLLSLSLVIGVPTALSDAEVTHASDVAIQVIGVAPGSPADNAGIITGDSIKKADNVPINRIGELQNYLRGRSGQPVSLTLDRAGQSLSVIATPTILDGSAGQPAIGVSLVHSGMLRYPWYTAVARGAQDTWNLTGQILSAFGHLFRDLIIRGSVPQDIAGPVGIAVLTGQVVELGFIYLLQFTALLSLNLAIINIFPFPALDGGRLLFVVLEKLRRKPVSQRVEGLAHQIGFSILIALVLIVTYRDIVRLGGGFFSSLGRIFGS